MTLTGLEIEGNLGPIESQIPLPARTGGSLQATIDLEDSEWRDYANCLSTDLDLFFPEGAGSTREAKEVCRDCVVRDPCLEYALANREVGIWGGTSDRERRRIRKRRKMAGVAAGSIAAANA